MPKAQAAASQNYKISKLPNYQILFRSRLSNLLLQALARVAHTFVLVRIRWTQRAHLCRDLPDLLPVNSGNRELGLLEIDGNFHARRQRIFDRMRIAEREHDRAFALHLSAISNADYFEVAGPSLGHALDRVVDQRASESVQGRLRIVLAHGDEMSVLLLDLDSRRHNRIQLAFRPLYRDRIAFDFDRHPFGKCDRLFS